MAPGKNYILLIILILFSILTLDQFTKILILKYLPIHENYTILENFLDITHIRNTGIAFGLFSEYPLSFKRIILITISFMTIAFVIYLLFKIGTSNKLIFSGLSLILGGAMGNLYDRIFRGGSVVDFIDVHWFQLHWPAFNVADSSITCGVFLLVIDTFISKDKTRD